MLSRLTGATTAARHLVPDPGFDATYGARLPELLEARAPGDEPDDLDAFWACIAAETAAVDPDPQRSDWHPHPAVPDTHEVADLRYRSLDGYEIGGWVVRPRAGADELVVVSHGYGGRAEPGIDGLPPTALAVMPVARGLPTRSEVPGVVGDGRHHAVWGIESPRTYSHVGAVADLWLATTIGQDLVPQARRTAYSGSSFGGGIGALVLAWDDRFDAAELGVPSFGNYPWRVTVDCLGSGQGVRVHLRTHPEAIETLRYVDAANAATRITIPTYVVAALADPAVPPPGQFAVAMSLAGPTWVHAIPAGHCESHELPDTRPDPSEIRAFLDEARAAVGG